MCGERPDPPPVARVSSARAEAPTVTVRAVLEDTPRFLAEGLALVRSLRAFGGPHANAPCELHFVERLPDDVSALAELDVTLKTVDRFDARTPHANKLGMFYPVETDYLLAVDADILVCADITPHLVGDAIAAVPAYGSVLAEAHWRELFAAAGLPFPAERVLAIGDGSEMIPYFNSGVLVVPKRQAATLAAVWAKHLTDLLDAPADRAWWGELQRFHVGQIALALAVGSDRFPHRALPIEMNYLLGFDRPEALDPGTRQPLLLHVLHRMNFDTGRIFDRGRLTAGYGRPAREAIARYNELAGASDAPA